MELNTQMAENFFKATASGDADALRQLCAADFIGRQNGGPGMNLDNLIAFSSAVLRAVKNFRYEHATRSATSCGFVEEHDVVADLPDGTELRLPACVVAQVQEGRIAAMHEYFDASQATGLLKALNG